MKLGFKQVLDVGGEWFDLFQPISERLTKPEMIHSFQSRILTQNLEHVTGYNTEQVLCMSEPTRDELITALQDK